MLSHEQQKAKASADRQKLSKPNAGPSSTATCCIGASWSVYRMQMTGKDIVGGIQLQIIPEFDCRSMSFSKIPDTVIDKYRPAFYRVSDSDSDLDLDSDWDPVPEDALISDVLKTRQSWV